VKLLFNIEYEIHATNEKKVKKAEIKAISFFTQKLIILKGDL